MRAWRPPWPGRTSMVVVEALRGAAGMVTGGEVLLAARASVTRSRPSSLDWWRASSARRNIWMWSRGSPRLATPMDDVRRRVRRRSPDAYAAAGRVTRATRMRSRRV